AGRDAVLELKDGEIHEIPPDPGGSRHYRRLTFRTHIIHIAGAGGVLEHTVRDSRGDRELSAHDLIAERAQVVAQYESGLRARQARLRSLGIDGAALAALAPERAPFGAQLRAALDRAFHRGDPLDR